MNYFLVHAVQESDGEGIHQHILVAVSWLKKHNAKNHFKKPVELWWKDLFEEDLDLFIPVQLIICHAVVSEVMHEGQTVYLTVPVRNIPHLL